MIVRCYKDVNLLADVFVFNNGARYAMFWNSRQMNKLDSREFAVVQSVGGMKYFAKYHARFILQHGVKI